MGNAQGRFFRSGETPRPLSANPRLTRVWPYDRHAMHSESPTSMPQVGPFRLESVIGQAGMGVVWRGHHTEQHIPVAIKFLTEEGARDPLYRSCLKNEVQKVAALDHPAIVRVYDHGEVPEGLSELGLIGGSPYLVMEWAEGGTLSRHCGHMTWDQAWRTLMRLMDGLAHAHARGVVHRDLKPGNVLLRRDSGGVVLTDFGLARAGDTDGGAILNAGTPSYMAPEQIQQLANEIGPWTDMYALGCLAWSLVSGRPPFVRASVEETLDAHLNDPVPELVAMTPVPHGFEEWVNQLLRKVPDQRFVRAADAAHALARLAPEEQRGTLTMEPVFARDTTTEEISIDSVRTESMTLEDTRVMSVREFSGKRDEASLSGMPAVERSMLWADRVELPPVPEDWREEHPPRPIPHLIGTGLGMFGFRIFPVVGRDHEQSLLWQELKDCRSKQQTRAVVLEGADGVGKSHLAHWLARRSYEVGASIVLKANFQRLAAKDPLVPMLSALLGCGGLGRKETEAQIRSALSVLGHCDDTEVDALLTVLGPFPGERFGSEQMEERNEIRFTVARRILHRFSLLRPLVLVLDDAHYSHDALRFAETLMAEQTNHHPLLIMLGVNTVTIADDIRRRLTEFKQKARVTTLDIGPLPMEHRATLVRTLLGLDPSLAALVERRSGGNPQFAVQLVEDWIQKDILVHGSDGFKLRPGQRPEFPSDMQAMWERRLGAALPADRDTRSLQIAAELGLDVDEGEWIEACQVLGLSPDLDLVERLTDAHLARVGARAGQWSFSHAMVCQSLKRAAEFEGNRPSHHQAVATMLLRREQRGPRLGRHLFEAGEYDAAVSALLEGARQSLYAGNLAAGWDLVVMRERALQHLAVPQTDLLWAEGWLLKGHFLSRRREFPAVMEFVDKALATTEDTPGAENLRARAWLKKGTVHRLMAEHEEARRCLNHALKCAKDDPNIASQAMQQLGTLEIAYGSPMLAARFYEGALDAANKMSDEDQVYQVRQNLASVYRRQGDLGKAREHLTASLEYYRSKGRKRAQSRSLNDLAELDRFTGDLAQAEAGYREALRLMDAIGDNRFYIAGLNLGIIYAETGRPVEARFQLEQCQQALRASRLPGVEGATLLFLAYVHAQVMAMREWRACFDAGRDLILQTRFADIDIARAAQKGGEVLVARDMIAQGRESLEFARTHWVQLGRMEEAAAVSRQLATLSA